MYSTRPSVSTRTWRFLPLISLPASKPCGSTPGPPFSALFTLWLSTIQAGGLASRRDQRLDLLPLQVGEIDRVAQPVTVIAAAVLGRPHRAPRESMPHSESQLTRALQAAVPPTGNRFK